MRHVDPHAVYRAFVVRRGPGIEHLEQARDDGGTHAAIAGDHPRLVDFIDYYQRVGHSRRQKDLDRDAGRGAAPTLFDASDPEPRRPGSDVDPTNGTPATAASRRA